MIELRCKTKMFFLFLYFFKKKYFYPLLFYAFNGKLNVLFIYTICILLLN